MNNQESDPLPLWLIGPASISMMFTLFLIFISVPTGATMGLIQRIFYFHVSCLIVRKAVSVDQRATICAVICIFGMADVPLVYMSNRIFRTQHPSPVIGGGPNSGLAPEMLWTFLSANVSMLLLWWCMIRLRRRVAQLDRANDATTRQVALLVANQL